MLVVVIPCNVAEVMSERWGAIKLMPEEGRRIESFKEDSIGVISSRVIFSSDLNIEMRQKNQILSLVRLVVHNGVAGERCQLTFHLLVLALEHFIGLQRRLQLSVDFFQFLLRFKSREGTPTLYFDCILVIRFRSRDSVFPSLPSMLCHNR